MTDDIDNEGTHSPGHGAHGGEREPVDLLELARSVGLRKAMHGVNPLTARALLKRFVEALAATSPDGAGVPVAWMRAGANLWHGWEACAEGDPNGFPVYRAAPQAQPEPALLIFPNPLDIAVALTEQAKTRTSAENIADVLFALNAAGMRNIAAPPTPHPAPSVQPPAEASDIKNNYTFEEVCEIETAAFLRGRNAGMKYTGLTQPPAPVVPLTIDNPWRESLLNCISGDNYLRSGEYHQLVEELDRLYAIEAAHKIGGKP